MSRSKRRKHQQKAGGDVQPMSNRTVLTETKDGRIIATEHYYAPKSALAPKLHKLFPQGAAVICQNQTIVAAFPGGAKDVDHMYNLLGAGKDEELTAFCEGLCAENVSPATYLTLFVTAMQEEHEVEVAREDLQTASQFADRAMLASHARPRDTDIALRK